MMGSAHSLGDDESLGQVTNGAVSTPMTPIQGSTARRIAEPGLATGMSQKARRDRAENCSCIFCISAIHGGQMAKVAPMDGFTAPSQRVAMGYEYLNYQC